jgi:hypothetical protein
MRRKRSLRWDREQGLFDPDKEEKTTRTLRAISN